MVLLIARSSLALPHQNDLERRLALLESRLNRLEGANKRDATLQSKSKKDDNQVAGSSPRQTTALEVTAVIVFLVLASVGCFSTGVLFVL